MICLLIFLTASCANLKTREQIESEKKAASGEAPKTAETEVDPRKEEAVISEELPELPPEMAKPELKVGIVFGPSGLLAPVQIGVLQELTKTKLPIHSVAGMEMGALVAALYAVDGRSNDAEWKYLKLREEDLISKSFLRGQLQPGSMAEFQYYLTENFGRNRVQDAALPFHCPALEISRANSKILSSGAFTEILPYCLAFPPFWQPVQGHIADPFNYGGTAEALRAAGANYVVLVQVLPDQPERAEGQAMGEWVSTLWSMVMSQAQQKHAGYDHVIRINVGNRGIVDFEARRELLRLGHSQGKAAARKLVQQHGL